MFREACNKIATTFKACWNWWDRKNLWQKTGYLLGFSFITSSVGWGIGTLIAASASSSLSNVCDIVHVLSLHGISIEPISGNALMASGVATLLGSVYTTIAIGFFSALGAVACGCCCGSFNGNNGEDLEQSWRYDESEFQNGSEIEITTDTAPSAISSGQNLTSASSSDIKPQDDATPLLLSGSNSNYYGACYDSISTSSSASSTTSTPMNTPSVASANTTTPPPTAYTLSTDILEILRTSAINILHMLARNNKTSEDYHCHALSEYDLVFKRNFELYGAAANNTVTIPTSSGYINHAFQDGNNQTFTLQGLRTFLEQQLTRKNWEKLISIKWIDAANTPFLFFTSSSSSSSSSPSYSTSSTQDSQKDITIIHNSSSETSSASSMSLAANKI